MFSDEVSIVRRGGRWRSRLRLKSGLMVSVVIARSVHQWKQTLRWQIDPVRHEYGLVTLIARLDEENRSFLDFHIVPNLDRLKRFNVSLVDAWLNRGQRLPDISAFPEVMARVRFAEGGDTLEGVAANKTITG